MTMRETTARLRKQLKCLFPLTTFSVRLQRFAGGNKITVSWNNGAPAQDVTDIVNQYNDRYTFTQTVRIVDQGFYHLVTEVLAEEFGSDEISRHDVSTLVDATNFGVFATEVELAEYIRHKARADFLVV